MSDYNVSPILEAITPSQFRSYFFRDFPYLPDYDNAKTYFKDDVVYLLSTNTFYQCIATTVGHTPPNSQYWAPVPKSVNSFVLDADISKAFTQALSWINPEIFEGESVMTDAYYYCAAHYLVMDIRMAERGLDDQGSNIVTSRSVGGVSESYGVPQKFLDNPQFGYFAKTNYGLKYLAYIYPRIIGRTVIASGATLP